MIPYTTYKLIHILGILLVFVALGGLALHAANGGTRRENVLRRGSMMIHGLGAFLILLGGFGMLARLGAMHGAGFPGWLWGKIVIWLIVGAAVILPYRRPAAAGPMFYLLPLLGATAAWLALYKPF